MKLTASLQTYCIVQISFASANTRVAAISRLFISSTILITDAFLSLVFQLLYCMDSLLSSVLYNSKQNVLKFCTVGWTKQGVILETGKDYHFSLFLIFDRLDD